MSKSKVIPEAPESNAGDDFHVLWTIKKSFDLLNFNDNGLKAIIIEGIDSKTALEIDPTGSKLLGVDIVEYFGGEKFSEANKVKVSQLKYSTRRISENWTFSKLYKGKKSRSTDGSVFHRLSQIYKTFLDEFGRKIILKKLTLKFVSNRSFSMKQKLIILDIQQFLRNKNGKVYLKSILDYNSNYKNALKKIHAATNLKSVEFVDFLRLLDFEDCGTDSSYYQELETIEALRNVGIQNSYQNDSLFRMVWRKMLPKAIKNSKNKITEIDLLHCLQMSMERMFPVPQSFEEIENIVGRKQVPILIDKIVKNNSNIPICLHGGAGIGKSTISQLIKQTFPSESEVILFDCYGAGSYLNPSDSRHLHKEAILQISNDLARRVGSPFLLSTSNDSYILVREFKRRVEDALNILRKKNPSAVLVLLVDASDNSITAAERNQTKSFIQDLVNEKYVDGFRLVVTSRSYRVSSLNLPDNYIDIPLDPFDLEETETHLKFYFPDISKEEILDFHTLTNGIPRVQTYALDLKKEGIEKVINYLKPNGKTVEDLIEDRITESIIKIGNNGKNIVNSFFTYLISLPRPVPIPYISRLSEINEGILLDLSTDIWYGLVLTNLYFSFRDEDFENYIRDKFKPNQEIKERIADLFLEKASNDEYASINLGIALYDARYEEKLKDIVLNEQYKVYPIDPVRKKEVFIERTKLAMKVSSKIDDNLTFFKLAFITAAAAKTDKALNDLIIENADLVATFGVNDSLERLHLQSDKKSWSGSFHYQLAVSYSREKNTIELAKKHLRVAEKWVSWLMQQEKTHELRNFRIHDEDIAHGAETYLRLFGSQVALDWLNRWTPKKALFKASNIFIDNILKYSSEEQILKWLDGLSLSLLDKLMILRKIKYFKIYPFDLHQIGNTILKYLSFGVKFKKYLLPTIISFCEIYIYSSSISEKKILKILDFIKLKLPDRVPALMNNLYREDEEDVSLDIFLKKYSLKNVLTNSSLKLIDIYPEKFKETKKEDNYNLRRHIEDEKKEFDRFYKHAISIYQLRADLFARKREDDLKLRFQNICKRISDDWEFRYYDSHWVSYRLDYLASRLVDILPYLKNGDKFIEILIDSFQNKNKNRISLRITIAHRMSFISTFNQCTYKLIDEVDSFIQKSSFISSDKINYYIQASRLMRGIDKLVSKFYFDKAVNAVSEIDLEAQEQIKCLSSLSQLGIPKDNPKLAFEFARFVEYCENHLSGYERFPLDEGIEGIAHLDCATSYAVICRWDHRYLTEMNKHVLSILKISIEKAFISPEIGSSMLPLNIYYWKNYVEYIYLLLEKFDNNHSSKQKSFFVKNILRDIQFNSGDNEKIETIKSIYEIIKDGKYLDLEIVKHFKKCYQFVIELQKDKNEEKNNNIATITRNRSETAPIPMINSNGLNVESTSSLSEIIENIKAKNDNFAPYQISQFLIDVKNHCTHENYVAHLDAFIDINIDLISLYSFEEAIKERLEEWSFHPLVRKWKKQNFSKVLKMWFSEFSWDEGIHYEGIQRFADIFSIDHSELEKIVFEILPEKIDGLSATAIYHTISFFKNRLSKSENEELISWVLPRWNDKIDIDFADGVWNDKYIPPEKSNDVIAETLRYTLGHPDKRIRWRGVHALRRMVNLGDVSILKSLLLIQNKPNCFPFQNEDYTFFWISAKLYLWISIERISKENPLTISQFKADVFKELQYKELPHTLILFFIKQTCLNLIEYDNALFTKEEIGLIKNILSSKFTPVKKDEHERKHRKHDIKNDRWKFDFDPLDTLPTWYGGLGRCFNISANEVADIADRYISEKWGFTGNHRQEDHVKGDYSLTSNKNGLPTIENLRTYYEYHAMFCSAKELLESIPLIEDEIYSWDTWDYWIESETTVWKGFWISDLRDPLPLYKRFWISEFEKFNVEWRDGVEDKHYDEIIGLSSNLKISTIIPYGGYTRYFGENYESVSIKSAIVTPDTSEALLKALQTTKDNHLYWLPLEEDELEINEGKFQLLGWLRKVNSEYEGLDKNDSFARDIGKNYILFGVGVEDNFEIKYSENFKQAYFNNKKVLEYQNWSDVTELKYSTDGSSGCLLHLSTSFLISFLQKVKMDLLIKCTISRQLKNKEYNFERPDRKNEAKLYLIKSNGEVKSIRGRNYQIG